jgi:hypothetical protein
VCSSDLAIQLDCSLVRRARIVTQILAQRRDATDNDVVCYGPSTPRSVDQLVIADDVSAAQSQCDQDIHDQWLDVFFVIAILQQTPLRQYGPGPHLESAHQRVQVPHPVFPRPLRLLFVWQIYQEFPSLFEFFACTVKSVLAFPVIIVTMLPM